MEEELKQYALQLKLQNPEITQEELTNKIIEFKNTLNVKAEPENGVPAFFAIQAVANAPLPGASLVNPKTKAEFGTFAYAVKKNPLAVFKGLLKGVKPGAAGAVDTGIEIVYDNLKDIEEGFVLSFMGGKDYAEKQQVASKLVAAKDAFFEEGYGKFIKKLLPAPAQMLMTGRKEAEKIRAPFKKIIEKERAKYGNTISEEILKGADADYESIGSRILSDGLTSLPYTIASMHPASAAYLGAGIAGDKFVEETQKNPDKTLFQLAGNAALTGGIEMADAWLTRKMFRSAGLLQAGKEKVAGDVVKQMNKGISQKALDIIGIGVKEGATEIGQAIATRINDKVWFNPDDIIKNIDEKGVVSGLATTDFGILKNIYSIIDEGIIGGFSGGGISSVSTALQSNSVLKQRAEQLLTPNSVNKRKSELYQEYIKRQNEITKAVEEGKPRRATALLGINRKISKEIRALERTNRLVIDNIQGEDLQEYANNIDSINALSEGGEISSSVQKEIDTLSDRNNEIFDTNLKNNYGDNVSFAEVASGQLGMETTVASSTTKFKELIKKETGRNIKDAEYTNGVFIGNGKVIINEEVALKLGAVGVGSHEILHPILNAMVGNIAAQQNIVEEFKNSLTSAQKKWTEGEMKRQGKIEGTKEYYSEYLTVFSEGLVKNRISFDLNFGEQIKDWITNLYKGKGYKNIDFKSGQGVYNFLKAYDKSRKEGGLSEEVLSVLDIEKVKKAKTLSDENQKSSISNEVQEIYNKKGVDGAFEILNKYEGMAKKQASRFRDVPGYATNSDLLVDEILTGKRGVFDLIRSYNPGSGVPLAAYINKFLKSRAIEAANRILDTKFKSDITEAKAVKAAPEVSEEAKISEERPSLRKTLGLSNEVIEKVKNAVTKSFGTKLPEATSKQFKNKLANNYKIFLKPTIAKMIGTKNNYRNFLNKNFELIYDIIPQSIINKRFKPFAEPVLDENGKQLRERTAQGNAIFRKKKISKEEFINYFLGDNVNPSTKGARKTTLSETLAQEIAFDATLDGLRNPEIFEKVKQISKTQEIDIADNYLSQVALSINRGVDFQFSSENTNYEDLYAIRDAIMDGVLQEKFPHIYDEVVSAARGVGLSIPSAFKGVSFEKYFTNIQNNKESKTLTVIGEGKMGKTGTDVIFNLTTKSVGKLDIGVEIKNGVRDMFGSASYKTNEAGGFETTNELMDDMLPFLAEKLKIYEDLHKRAEEIQGETIPFEFPQKGYLKSTWDQLKNEFRSKERNIQIIFNNSHLIEQYYNNKGIFAMYIGNKGLFHLGRNKYHLKAPRLESKMKTYVSLRSSKTREDGKVTLVLRGFNALVNGKNIPKGTLINDNNFENNYFDFSKEWQDLDFEFNEILEEKTGIESFKRFSEAKGKVRGRKQKMMNFFIPYSAEDFQGLMYALLPKGKKGDLAMEWMKENLFRPYSQAMENISKDRAIIMNDFNDIKNKIADVPASLDKKVGDYTNQEAIRVWIWNKQKMEIPGLTQTDENLLVDTVNDNKKLLKFAKQLIKITKKDKYSKPGQGWLAGNIQTDLLENLNTVKRKKHLKQWKENVNIIFSEKNKNKLRAAYGDDYIISLDNILKRMESGRNRNGAGDPQIDKWMDWLNNSVGAIMFVNIRSAVLQTISTVNYMNWSDNNPLMAAKAFANQPQFWKDFSFIFNSSYLKERRGDLQLNVSENEIANAAKKGGVRGAISYLLNKGFVLTRIADSFAISNGGAALYRNRVNSYIKEGLSKKEAEQKAFIDFKEITEESQQSSRPDRISKEQAGGFGRVILAFANTPMQYTRLMKRATQDLINKRGDQKTNISKLIYYGAVQNFIFNALQQALFVLGFDSDEEKEKEKQKYINILDSMLDSILRGTGVAGSAVMVGKNFALDIIKRKEKPKPNLQDSAWKLLDISPPLDSKITKIRSALYTLEYQGDEIKKKGVTLNSPGAMAIGQTVSAFTNVPLDRIMRIYDNTRAAVASDTETWQRVALLLGWSTWELGIQKPKQKTKKKKSSIKTLKF